MTGTMLQFVHALLALIRVLSGALLVGSAGLNFANIIARYFLHSSVSWAEEVMLFMMVGCVFLGSGIVTWSGRHIRMDIVVRLMPAKVQAVLDLLSELVLLATAILLLVFTWPVISQLVAFDQRSLAANMPLAIPQAMIPIGLSFIAFFVIARLIVGRPGPSGSSDH